MISLRHYLLPEDGSLKRLSRRVVDGLLAGTDGVMEYAGTRQRVAAVIVRLEERKPVAILDFQGVYWIFDAEGGIDQFEHQKVVSAAMELAFSSPPDTKGKIVSLAPALQKRAYEVKHRWEPSKAEIDRIAADLWPDAQWPAGSVETVKGKTPVKPPLTWEGERALSEINSSLFAIGTQLGKLGEKALKGLAFEARRNAMHEDQKALWAALAEEADQQRELLARRRTGKGVWYAVIEGFIDDPADMVVTQLVDIAHERCDGRAAAVEAARRLIREHADKVDAGTRVEACVRSELEWQPADE